jgi:lipopolysaccharide export system permease protein
MTAIRACGSGPERLYLPVMVLALAVAGGLAWLAFDVAPTAYARAQELKFEALREAQFGRLEPGKFRSFADGSAVFYAESADAAGVLHNVFLERQRRTGVEIATAARAVHRIEEGGRLHVVVLYDGERYEGVPGEPGFRRVRFVEHGIPVRIPDPRAGKVRREQKSTPELWRSSDPGDTAELQWRISLPLMVLVLALLAVPLSALRPREGRYARVTVAILFYFIYSNLISVSRNWIEQGQLDPHLGVWWVHALAVVVALVLLHRQSPLPLIMRRYVS